MRHLIAHSMAHGLDELRVLTLLATAAFVTGGATGSVALTLAWVVEHLLGRGELS